MNIPMNLSMNIHQVLNTLIQNRCINIKKSYRIYKDLIDNTEIIIKNIYCKNRRPNGELCLNRCIEESKCCGIHDEIMRENRKKMNLWRRESKKYNNIGEDIFQDSNKNNNKDNNEDNTLSYIPEYTELIIEPSAPLLQNIINPPDYIQKPDECGNTIINTINYNQDNSQIDLQEELHEEYKLSNINNLYIPEDTKELENRFQDYRNSSIIKNNLVDYLQEYQFTLIDKPINNYLEDIQSTNFKDLQIKGIKSHRIINELIAINVSSYYKAYNRIPSTNFFYKYANTISTIIKNIPK